MPHKYFNHAKSILCLNGEIPDDRGLFKDKVVVATDGAADRLIKMGVRPSVIIGDFDSIQESNYQGIKMVHLPDQNQSDFQKSLKYLAQKKLLPTVVCGMNGGCIDHVLHNINVILQNNCIFYAPPLIGQVLNGPAVLKFDIKVDTKISLLGMAKATVKTSGLKWDLNQATLEFPGSNSCFNRTAKEEIIIEVLEGKLLLLIYLENMQDAGVL